MKKELLAVITIVASTGAIAADKSAAPTGDAAAWFTTDDYPAEALRAGAEGMVAIKYDIDATGKVSFCTVTQTSGSAALDETSCRLIKERGRFTPALDKKGKPMASQGTRRVNWQLPDVQGTQPLSNLPNKIVLQYDVDPDGVRSNCSVMEVTIGGKAAPEALAKGYCNGSENTKSRPYTDSSRQRVKVRVQIMSELKLVSILE